MAEGGIVRVGPDSANTRYHTLAIPTGHACRPRDYKPQPTASTYVELDELVRLARRAVEGERLVGGGGEQLRVVHVVRHFL